MNECNNEKCMDIIKQLSSLHRESNKQCMLYVSQLMTVMERNEQLEKELKDK